MQANTAIAAPPASDTAARLGALIRYLFVHDGGAQLRAMEQSGLTLTQCKALFLLGAPDAPHEQLSVKALADGLGISLASASRAAEGMVRKRLATRVEDRADRRLRRIALTAKGRRAMEEIIAARMSGLEDFAASLSSSERRKLDAALEVLLDREEIAAAYEQLRQVRP